VDGGGRIALGSTYQSCNITGNTTVTVPGVAPATSPGGLLALPSNIGSYSREVLTFVPEVGYHLGYFVTETVRLRAGYTFLYWSSVARAGNVINPNVNPNLLPPSVPGAQPAQPAFNWNGTGIWAQGIDLGLEWRFKYRSANPSPSKRPTPSGTTACRGWSFTRETILSSACGFSARSRRG